MQVWMEKWLHDGAGGVLGGMGGATFGPVGCAVGYICGAYMASATQIQAPTPYIPIYSNPFSNDGNNHNKLLSQRFQTLAYPNNFSFVIEDVKSMGYEIPGFINEDWLKQNYMRLTLFNVNDKNDFKSLYSYYASSQSMRLLSNLMDKIYTPGISFNQLIKYFDEAQLAANRLKDAEIPTTMLQLSLSVFRSSAYFWYKGYVD